MRVVVVDDSVHFHSGILKEEVEEYCSCSRQRVSSYRNLEKRDDKLYISIPNKEYVALVLQKRNTHDDEFYQQNLSGVSIYTTKKYMVWIRFAKSYQTALQYLHQQQGEEKYIISTEKIDNISPSEIFVYESSFGDVFSLENYSGNENATAMETNLKRTSYTTLDDSYWTCWL